MIDPTLLLKVKDENDILQRCQNHNQIVRIFNFIKKNLLLLVLDQYSNMPPTLFQYKKNLTLFLIKLYFLNPNCERKPKNKYCLVNHKIKFMKEYRECCEMNSVLTLDKV